jgi:hypothetical protein
MTCHSGLTLANVGVDTGVCEIDQPLKLSLETGQLGLIDESHVKVPVQILPV